ncbi:MAG: hypothetical protein H7Z72_18000 [Bacteroidetes bacterium]|nr:hypothetical protein [Fibrella sp.]
MLSPTSPTRFRTTGLLLHDYLKALSVKPLSLLAGLFNALGFSGISHLFIH